MRRPTANRKSKTQINQLDIVFFDSKEELKEIDEIIEKLKIFWSAERPVENNDEQILHDLNKRLYEFNVKVDQIKPFQGLENEYWDEIHNKKWNGIHPTDYYKKIKNQQ